MVKLLAFTESMMALVMAIVTSIMNLLILLSTVKELMVILLSIEVVKAWVAFILAWVIGRVLVEEILTFD
jgi:hypothetical protein